MSKYNSKKVEYNGIKFDSKVELDYYHYLNEQLDKGLIKSFELQVKVELIPKYEKFGIKHRAITYTPDFLIIHLDGSKEYVDIKGFGTLASDLRRKLFDYLYPNDKLTWLSYVKKYGGWIEYTKLKKMRKGNKNGNREQNF